MSHLPELRWSEKTSQEEVIIRSWISSLVPLLSYIYPPYFVIFRSLLISTTVLGVSFSVFSTYLNSNVIFQSSTPEKKSMCIHVFVRVLENRHRKRFIQNKVISVAGEEFCFLEAG